MGLFVFFFFFFVFFFLNTIFSFFLFFFRLHERLTACERGVLTTHIITRGYKGPIKHCYLAEGMKRFWPAAERQGYQWNNTRVYINIGLREEMHATEVKEHVKDLIEYIPNDCGVTYDPERERLFIGFFDDSPKYLTIRDHSWQLFVNGQKVNTKVYSSVRYVHYNELTLLRIIDTARQVSMCQGLEHSKCHETRKHKVPVEKNDRGETVLRHIFCLNTLFFSNQTFACNKCLCLTKMRVTKKNRKVYCGVKKSLEKYRKNNVKLRKLTDKRPEHNYSMAGQLQKDHEETGPPQIV